MPLCLVLSLLVVVRAASRMACLCSASPSLGSAVQGRCGAGAGTLQARPR